jgi:hypothetical protein
MTAYQQAQYLEEQQKEKRRKWLSYITGGSLALYFMRFILGSACFSYFSFLENTFRFSDDVPPVFLWMSIGLLFGAAAGALVAGRKFNLSNFCRFGPAVLFVVVVIICSLVNKPFALDSPVSHEVSISDSASLPERIKAPLKRKLKRKHKIWQPVAVAADSSFQSGVESTGLKTEDGEGQIAIDTTGQKN